VGCGGLHYSQYKVTYSSGTPRKLPYYAKHVHISTGLSLFLIFNILYFILDAELHLGGDIKAAGNSVWIRVETTAWLVVVD
jgi:hypothetical protein